jgi:hypothetical protein
MTTDRDLNRIVRSWLDEGVTALPDHLLDSVIAQVPATPQRHPSWLARRTPPMNKYVSVALAAAAVVVMAIIGIQLVGPFVGGPIETPTPIPSQSIQPTATPAAIRQHFTFVGSDVRVSAEVPDSWTVQSWFAMPGTTQPPDGLSVSFEAITNTFSDPCGHVLRTPVIGSSTTDLVNALVELPNHTATQPAEDSIGGLPATYLELTADDPLPCAPDQFFMWTDDPTGEQPGTGLFAQGHGQIFRMWVLEVGGERVTVFAMRFPTSTEEAVAEQQAILDSIQFE